MLAAVVLAVGLALVTACGSPAVDVTKSLAIVDVTTGWFDAGIVEGGMNKLVPSISFRLKNVSNGQIASVQLMAPFRRVGENDEWGSSYVQVIGPEGLASGATTAPIVLRNALGYTGLQARTQMLQNHEFVDARVELFAKSGSQKWIKIAEYRIMRQLLTH